MAESNQTFERLMEEIDKEYSSPSIRSAKIWAIIQATPNLIEKTDWDLLCFCVEFIALQSQQYKWLEEDAHRLVHLLYTAHYVAHDNDDNKREISRPIRIEGKGGDKSINNDSGKVKERKLERNGDGSISSRFPFE